MAGLETYDENNPAGTETLQQGDNRIRELAQKTKASVDLEHHLSGEHNIPRGTTGGKPAATKDGRLFILENSGVEVELEYANGSVWIKLTRNSEMAGIIIDNDTLKSGLATHIAANPIDHPTESVTSIKVKKGHILRKHINSVDGNQEGSVANLVNGTVLPADGTWHTHTAVGGSGLITFLPNAPVEIASGAGSTGWVIKDLASSGIPATAVGVILQAAGNGIADFNPVNVSINIRKNSSSSALSLIAGFVDSMTLNLTNVGQGIYPVDTSTGSAKLEYEVFDYNVLWKIAVIGYFL